jgi:hypothetical protein
LYPNPTTASILLSNTEESSITLFDLQGKLLYKKTNTDKQTLIDVSNYATGLYIAHIVKGDKSTNILFQKE